MVGIGREPTIVEMEIMGLKVINTIIDRRWGVNVLPEETWKRLGKPILWPLAFHLVGAN